jgi:SRSO17 transposase
MGLQYAVGVTSAVVLWPPRVEPLLPKRYSGRAAHLWCRGALNGFSHLSVKALALSLPEQEFQTTTWREGTNEPLSGRFAALRVRHAGGNVTR